MVRLGNWYKIYGPLGKCMGFQRKNFFQSFNTFFCFENDLSVIFGLLTPNLIKVPIFIKIQRSKIKIWTKMNFQDGRHQGEREGLWSQTFDHNISETTWDRSLKLRTFTYLHNMYICFKFHWNLKRWVSGMSQFDVEFPSSKMQK